VPLFTGFMCGSVGSFIARAIRVFDMRFSDYPKPRVTTVTLIFKPKAPEGETEKVGGYRFGLSRLVSWV